MDPVLNWSKKGNLSLFNRDALSLEVNTEHEHK